MLPFLDLLQKINFVFKLNFFSYIPISIFFVVLTFSEILSLGLIIPYMNIIFNPSFLSDFEILKNFSIFEKKTNDELIILFSLIFIFVFFVKTVLIIFVRAFIKSFSLKNIKNLQINLMDTYQKMSFDEYNKKKHSDYIRNIRELSAFCMNCLESLLRIISETIVLIAILVFLIFVEPVPLLIISFIMLLFITLYNFFLKPKTISWGKKRTDATKLIYQSIDESFKGFKEIKTLGKQSFFSKFLKRGTEIIFKNDLKSSIIMTSPRYFLELIIVVFIILNLGFSVYTKGMNYEFLPILAIFALAGLRILPSIALISNDILQIGFFSEGLNVIYNDLKKYDTSKSKKIANKNKSDVFEKIEIKDISFSYPGLSKQILDKTRFKLSKREFIGIIGPTGSGKTTFLDIFLGLLKPSSGEILFNNKPIFDEPIINLVEIGYLPQDNFIINDTLVSNITLSYEKEEIDLKKIKNIVNKLDLDHFVNQLPKGINSVIGESGLKLSGGQRQKICLARLLYHEKEILILDEVTNALDKVAEENIIKILKNLNKTIILISHDHNNMRLCNRVYKIDKNKLQETDIKNFL